MKVSFTSTNIYNSALYPNIQQEQLADIAERVHLAREEKAHNADAFVFEHRYLAKDGIVSEIVVVNDIDGKALNTYQKMINELRQQPQNTKTKSSIKYFNDVIENSKTFLLKKAVRMPKEAHFIG